MYVCVYMSLPLRAERVAIPSAYQLRGGLFDELEKKGRLFFKRIFFVVFSTDTREICEFLLRAKAGGTERSSSRCRRVCDRL